MSHMTHVLDYLIKLCDLVLMKSKFYRGTCDIKLITNTSANRGIEKCEQF
jgi:hypothetical protein